MFQNPLEEQGGGTRTTPFRKKKSSLRALRAHNERTYTNGTLCAGTCHAPFVGCTFSGPKTWVM